MAETGGTGTGRRRPVVLAAIGGFAVGALTVGAVAIARDDDPSADLAAPLVQATAAPTAPAATGPADRVGERTTATGIELRVFRSVTEPDPDETVLPERCRATGSVEATAIGRSAVTTARALTTSTPGPVPNTGVALGGAVEDDPILAVVVQVAPDIDQVALSGGDGADDVTEPVDGVAAVAVPVSAELVAAYAGTGAETDPAAWDGITLTLRHRDGSVSELDGAALAAGPGVWDDPGCRTATDDPPTT